MINKKYFFVLLFLNILVVTKVFSGGCSSRHAIEQGENFLLLEKQNSSPEQDHIVDHNSPKQHRILGCNPDSSPSKSPIKITVQPKRSIAQTRPVISEPESEIRQRTNFLIQLKQTAH